MGCANSSLAAAEKRAQKTREEASAEDGAEPQTLPEKKGAGALPPPDNGNIRAEPQARPPETVKTKTPVLTTQATPTKLRDSINAKSLADRTKANLTGAQVAGQDDGHHAKQRRQAVGSEAVRDNIRKMAVGGPQTAAEKNSMYAISDSEDEELLDKNHNRWRELAKFTKSPEVTNAIATAMKKSLVFKGIPDHILVDVVDCMYGVSYKAGNVVLQQGAMPSQDDNMYVLDRGEAEVVIYGAVSDKKLMASDEGKKVDGNVVRIPQRQGWVFGDVALLFNSPRSASVVAKTNITLWCLDRRTFLQFVLKHAQGARTLRYVRRLPLLKGLSDNDLIRVAGRMKELVYEEGQALIRYGERGDDLYLIRYGKVRVMRPDDAGGRVEVAVLGRGQFVGERTVITGKLRSADCVASGRVQVVVLNKKDFMDLDNPLLTWMLDYDAIATVLKSLPLFCKLKQEQLEHIIDGFDAREELAQGHVIFKEGDPIEKLYIVKMGEVRLVKNGEYVIDNSFVKESGGFTFFGDASLERVKRSEYMVVVASESLHILCMRRKQLDLLLSSVGAGLLTSDSIVAALKKIRECQAVQEDDIRKLVDIAMEQRLNAFEVVQASSLKSNATCSSMFMVKSGEVVVLSPSVNVPENGVVDISTLSGHIIKQLKPGDVYNEAALFRDTNNIEASLVASVPSNVLVFDAAKVAQALGSRLSDMLRKNPMSGKSVKKLSFSKVKYGELEPHRVIGTGQFGMVRVVRHMRSNEVYALKMMHKAPIAESKQIEHVINERKILEEASKYPFCVHLIGAYQDKQALYLLQEWVPGGELFHHLDLEGAFDEPTAMFYAANVLMALEYLHSKGVVYRDLKPENLLIDVQGYCRMADFGFAKFVGDDKTFTICGTPDYQAPEVIMRRGTTKAADYWALGVLIFEMLVGDPPFKSTTGDPWDTFRRTLSGRFYVPNFISDAAADLIFKLLQVQPEKRLGSGKLGADEIKRHRWFAKMDWKALEEKRLPAPLKVKVKNPMDTSNFDNFDQVDTEPPPVPPNAKEQLWELWDWIDDYGAMGSVHKVKA